VSKLYYKQYNINYEAERDGETIKTAILIKINHYFDPLRRSREMLELDIAISYQRTALAELLHNKSVLDDYDEIKYNFSYFKIIYYIRSRVIKLY
jgi:hypothetical protein